jgi:transcription antitermination factor NusG
MPILPAEPDLYPPDLWTSGALRPQIEPGGDGLRWWCLHTKPRQEKTTARHLRSRGVAFYLPMAAQESRTPQGRKIRSVVPLFTSYLFLLGDARDRLEAFQANSLVQSLEVGDQEELDRDLRQLHRMLGSGLPVVPETVHPVGSEVRIVGGPLAGLLGRVVRRGGRDRFTALVRFLGRGASIDLQDWQVEHVKAS